VTVPHAACPPASDRPAWAATGEHACDLCGPRSGRRLAEALRPRWRLGQVRLIEADVPRTTLDMNRRPSRGSAWRRGVADVLSGGSVACLIDAHSYPREYAPFFGCDVVLYTETERAVARWQSELALAVEAGGRLRCGMVANPDTTDLIQDAHERGVPAVLIEFSEGLDEPSLRDACERIATCVVAAADAGRLTCPPVCRACRTAAAPRYRSCCGGCSPRAVYCSRECQAADARRHAAEDACPWWAARRGGASLP